MTKHYIIYTLTVLLSLFIITAEAQSQEGGTPESVADATKLRAIAIGLQDDLKNLVILDASMQPAGKLTLRKFAFSSAFNCPVVEGRLIFGVPNGVDEYGNELFKPVASVNWKNSYKEVCLLFLPKSLIGKNDSANAYAIQVLDMSNKFKSGHTTILNLTPLDTMVRMGEHKTTIKGWAKSDISEIKEVTDLNMTQVEVFYKHNDTIHTAQQTRIRYLDRVRYITLIYPDIQNKRMSVNIVKDFGKLY